MSSAGTAQPSGVASFLNGIASPTTTSSSTQYPLWLQQAIEGIAGAAGNLAQQPYQPFPGPTVATPSAQTTQAEALAGQNVGNYQPALNQAAALTNSATQPLTAGNIQNFLNPYQNYVTGALNTNLQQNILPGIQDKFVSAGQSRSPQEAQVTGQAIYGTQQAAGQALAGGYQGALNSLQQQNAQQLQGGAQLGTLSALTSQLGTNDVGQLAAAGSTQDQYSQANINSALNQYQQQLQYPYQNLSYLSDIINRTPLPATGPTSTSVTSNPLVGQASPLAQYSSGYSNATGLGSNISNFGLAKGGRVPGRRVIGALQNHRMAA